VDGDWVWVYELDCAVVLDDADAGVAYEVDVDVHGVLDDEWFVVVRFVRVGGLFLVVVVVVVFVVFVIELVVVVIKDV